MRHIERTDSRYGFFRPFFKTGLGRILGLATPTDNMRDGLATTQLARFFPLPEFEGIVVEPGRPTSQPAENLILVGSAWLFLKPDAHSISGGSLPLGVGEEKLGERLRKIDAECCFEFTCADDRAVVNEVTEAVHRPYVDGQADLEVDFGVIRRLLRSPAENTIILEGLHRLGTLGAAKVATSEIYLDAIWEAVSQIDGFDEARPLEILVRSTFQPKLNHHVYSLDTIKAVPLTLVYNRISAYDLIDGHRWVDQRPWDVHVWIRGDDGPVTAPASGSETLLPRLELQAELGGLNGREQELCRELLGARGTRAEPPREEDAVHLLEALTSRSDRFRILLAYEAPWGAGFKSADLPQGHMTPIRRLRKQFLLHLVLCRALGRGFRCDEPSIRLFFPKFGAGSSARPLVAQFIGSVPGKMREGFEPLLGSTRKQKNHLQIDYKKKSRTYELRLDRIALVLKLRF